MKRLIFTIIALLAINTYSVQNGYLGPFDEVVVPEELTSLIYISDQYLYASFEFNSDDLIDNIWLDSSGHRNNGTNYSGVATNGTVEFQGGDSRMDVPSMDDNTMTMVIKAFVPNTITLESVFLYSELTTPSAYVPIQSFYINTSNYIRFRSIDNTGYDDISSASSYDNIGVWKTYVFRQNGLQTTVWMDGVEVLGGPEGLLTTPTGTAPVTSFGAYQRGLAMDWYGDPIHFDMIYMFTEPLTDMECEYLSNGTLVNKPGFNISTVDSLMYIPSSGDISMGSYTNY